MSKKAKKKVCPFCYQEARAWKKEEAKDIARKTVNVEVCPSCHSVIPPEFDDCDEIFPILVVGPTRSGKTHFLAVMAHELTQGGPWSSYWDVRRVIRQKVVAEDDLKVLKQADRFVEFQEQLYAANTAEGAALDATEPDREESTCAMALYFEYRGGARNLLKEPCRKKRVLVTFSDTAGETFRAGDWSNVPRRYPVLNGHAKAMIAILDPLELQQLRAEAEEEESKSRYVAYGVAPPSGGKVATVNVRDVLTISDFLKRMKRNPLALCLTKTDALAVGALGKIKSQNLLLTSPGGLKTDPDKETPSQTEGKLALLEIKEVSEQTKEFVKEQDGGSTRILDAVEKYKYNCYFAVDALGTAFQGGRRVGEPQPRRILDPLLWILWQYRLCGGR